MSSRMMIVIVLLGSVVVAQPPQGNGGPPPCPDTSSCLGLTAGAACHTIDRSGVNLTCGKCAVANSCALACITNTDQTQCTTIPTCTKMATNAGGFGIASVCGTSKVIAGDTFREPKVFESSNGTLSVVIAVKMATFNATAFTFQSRQYCVGLTVNSTSCSVPAATLRFKPGDVVSVTLINNLGQDYTSSKSMNTLRSPNEVNLHTHGLHVDPTVDNVMVKVQPGANKTYRYVVPADHLPGTHWYHSHVHGSSALQVMGGMSGALIVDAPATGFTFPASAAYKAMKTHLVHITHTTMCSCNPTNDPFAYRSYPLMAAMTGDGAAVSNLKFKQQTGFTEKDILLVNGQYQPRLAMLPKEWRRFEVVNAQGQLYMELEIRSAVAGGTSTACSMILLANDGIFLKASRNLSVVLLPPAGRASIAVMCSAAGTYYFQSNPQGRAADYEALLKQNLITLVVSGSATATTATVAPVWKAGAVSYPRHLQDLTSAAAKYTIEIGVDQTGVPFPAGAWLGIGKNCTLQSSGRGAPQAEANPNTVGQCAYEPFDMTGDYRFAAPTCSVVDLIIYGRGRTPHPIHMHVFPMQLISYVGEGSGLDDFTSSGFGVMGDWRDTIPAMAGKFHLRFYASKWVGPVMIHCHFLFHEDMGMMDRWWAGAKGSAGCTATSLAKVCNSSVPLSAFQTTFASTLVDCDSTTQSPPSTFKPPTSKPSTGKPSTSKPLTAVPATVQQQVPPTTRKGT